MDLVQKMDQAECGWDLAEVRASQLSYGFDPSILWHSGIWGAADEAVLNIVHKQKKSQKILF
jgi:hypothetical protein